MLDPNQLRKDLDSVVAALQKRKNPQPYLDVAAYSALETERKTIQMRTEELQNKRNTLSKSIGMLKAKGESTDAVMAETRFTAMQWRRMNWSNTLRRVLAAQSRAA